jgi:hypothetical protein
MWEVITSPEFNEWFAGLAVGPQDRILAGLQLLSEGGPAMGRPHADTVRDSTVPNLKELRVQVGGDPYRIFFAFDPVRRAVVLCGGDKTSDKRFYKRMIPLAEAIFRRHLRGLESEQGG